MKIQELCNLENLLNKWNNEVAFSPLHTETANTMILWVQNIIKIKVANKEA